MWNNNNNVKVHEFSKYSMAEDGNIKCITTHVIDLPKSGTDKSKNNFTNFWRKIKYLIYSHLLYLHRGNNILSYYIIYANINLLIKFAVNTTPQIFRYDTEWMERGSFFLQWHVCILRLAGRCICNRRSKECQKNSPSIYTDVCFPGHSSLHADKRLLLFGARHRRGKSNMVRLDWKSAMKCWVNIVGIICWEVMLSISCICIYFTIFIYIRFGI